MIKSDILEEVSVLATVRFAHRVARTVSEYFQERLACTNGKTMRMEKQCIDRECIIEIC